MHSYLTPGVYWEHVFPEPPRELHTGVPVFIGLIEEQRLDVSSDRAALRASPAVGIQFLGRPGRDIRADTPERLARWPEFEDTFGALRSQSYLAHAVRGFFENDGRLCYVQVVSFKEGVSVPKALDAGLKMLEPLETVDLVCAPDIMWPHAGGELLPEDDLLRMQSAVLKHCKERGDRLAILDPPPGASVKQVKEYPAKLREVEGLPGTSGALYYPWIRVLDGPAVSDGFVPPCGHVAGMFARTDERVGVHKAPANEILEGVVDLEVNLTNTQQGELNPVGVNCLRAFPGRGIRAWGARTLVDPNDRAWMYVNVRRLFLTAGRWIERYLTDVVFEPHNPSLWERIKRELNVYFDGLFRQGALKGSTPQEAFYVKCDEDINPPAVRDLGHVVTEIGLAPALPNEFVVVRIIHSASGLTVAGPIRPE